MHTTYLGSLGFAVEDVSFQSIWCVGRSKSCTSSHRAEDAACAEWKVLSHILIQSKVQCCTERLSFVVGVSF